MMVLRSDVIATLLVNDYPIQKSFDYFVCFSKKDFDF